MLGGEAMGAARRGAMFGLVLTSLALPAGAEMARGDKLAGSCAACHGPEGRSPGEIPAIADIAPEEMARLLGAYRSGELEGTVMNRIARGFTDDEIAAIAAHFAALR
ncbi:MAG: c-type cytochrome [Alphaproteobacteria bacterium]|nr:c-type cytochrome [Alphaproteobacteria bacterium]